MIGLVLACLFVAPSSAAPFEDPPLIGQPEDFSGAIGQFKASAQAEPSKLQAEDPLELILRFGSTGAGKGPRRPDLRKLDDFASRFHIEDLGAKQVDDARGKLWEFRYRLKPLSDAVTEIPSLRFIYYKPGSIPPSKGYRTTYTRSIPLEVYPRERAILVDDKGAPVRPPERIFALATGSQVLRSEQPPGVPDPRVVALFFAVPPLLFLLYYIVWRMRNPDKARLARRRKSRAARQALRELHALHARTPDDQARLTARVLGAYLCERLDFPLREPTPREAALLAKLAVPSETLAQDIDAFYRDCDAVRFGPAGGPTPANLADRAEQIIVSIESEPCTR